MRYIGIDYGTKRVGVALSDEGGRMAFPHSVLTNNAALLDALCALIIRERVEAVVFGNSQDFKGNDNPVMTRARACAESLATRLAMPVHFESEVLSTQEALRAEGRTALTDASAAAIILNSFLSKQIRS